MRKIVTLISVLMFSLLLQAPARADGIAVGAGVSTLGFGIHAATEINSFLALRLNGNFGDFDVPDFGLLGSNLGGLDYDIDAKMQTIGLLADFHPLGLSPIGGGFVLTGGVYYSKNEFEFTTDGANIPVGGGTVTGRLVSTMSFDQEYAPYVGLGYDGTFQGILPVSIFATAGVLFQGSPSVTSSVIGTCTGCNLVVEASELAADASDFEYYPVVALGMTISF